MPKETLRLRPHHIGMFIDDRGNIIEKRPLLFYLECQYDKNLAEQVVELSSRLTPTTQVEIVSGQDIICCMCPYTKYCGAGEYDKMLNIMKKRSPRFIYEPFEVSILKGQTPEKADEETIKEYNLEERKYTVGELCELFKTDS